MLLAFDTATPLVTVALHDGVGRGGRGVVRPADEARRAARPADRAGARARRASSARDLTADRASASGPGPSRGCGSAWSRPGRSASCSRSRSTGCARSTSSRSRPSTPARSPATSGSPRTRGARRSTSRRTTGRGAGARARRCCVPTTRPPTCRWRARVPRLYPDAFPHAVEPDPAQCRVAGPRAGRRAGRGARARPALPAPSRRRRARRPDRGPDDPAGRDPTTLPAVADARGRQPRPRRVAVRLRGRRGSPARCRRRPGGSPSSDGAVVGHAVVSIVAEVAELQRISVDAGASTHRSRGRAAPGRGGPGHRPRAPSGCCWRSGSTTTTPGRSTRRSGYAEIDAPPPLLRGRRRRRGPRARPLALTTAATPLLLPARWGRDQGR